MQFQKINRILNETSQLQVAFKFHIHRKNGRIFTSGNGLKFFYIIYCIVLWPILVFN